MLIPNDNIHNTENNHRESYRLPQGGQTQILNRDTNFLPDASPITPETNDEKGHRVILTLDLGTNMGWAIQGYTGIILHGTVEFRAQRFEGGGMPFLLFQRWLDKVKYGTGKIDEVYFEEVRRHLGVSAAHMYGGFLAYLIGWCEQNEIPYLGIPVGTIKKHITGKGNASKKDVIRAIQAKGINPKDDNAADALSLLGYILKTYYQDNRL